MKAKVEFIERWARNEETIEAMESDLDSVIQQAIAEHEQSQWKKYPENKPKDGYYWVTYSDGRVNDLTYEKESFGFSDNRVIAFMPFEKPKPYKERIEP